MSKSLTRFKSKEQKNREQTADLLRLLADKVSKGQISLKQGEQEVELELPDLLRVDVEVTKKVKPAKGTRHQLEIEINWYEGEASVPLELS